MADFKLPDRRSAGPGGQVLKTCPWCRGALGFQPYYPVMRLFPGNTWRPADDVLPEPLRTLPAWVCETPHCKFREPA